VHPFSAFTMSVCQLRPESTGEIRLRSADPEMHPAIRPNYLATETDRRTMIDAVNIARSIASHSPLAEKIATSHNPAPGTAEDDAGTLDWIRRNSTTIYHPTGTCRMGVDDAAVVDPRLRVRGIDGLRVADCAIMPRIVSGNTNAPAIMIGEKASDMILQDHA
jgi:choline dehydrogenase